MPYFDKMNSKQYVGYFKIVRPVTICPGSCIITISGNSQPSSITHIGPIVAVVTANVHSGISPSLARYLEARFFKLPYTAIQVEAGSLLAICLPQTYMPNYD